MPTEKYLRNIEKYDYHTGIYYIRFRRKKFERLTLANLIERGLIRGQEGILSQERWKNKKTIKHQLSQESRRKSGKKA